MPQLAPGDMFPALRVATVDGPFLDLPDVFAGRFGVVLFYRGAWCPYCNAQLRAFERARSSWETEEIGVVALSVDDEDTTRATVERHSLSFPLGHSADAVAIADSTGAFVNREPTFLQSTGFVLDRAGRVLVSVYSSGAIGRLDPADVVGLVRYVGNVTPT